MGVTNLLLSAVAALVDPVLVADQVSPLLVSASGRLKTDSKPGAYPTISGALTASAQALAVDVNDASNIIFHLKNLGTSPTTAGAFAFEGSVDSTDGVDGTWFSVQAVRTDSNTVENSRATSSLAAGAAQAYGWELSVNGFKWFRIRCTTTPTNNSTPTWTVVRGAYATEPIPATQTATVSINGTTIVQPGTPSNYGLISAATTNAAVVKNSAGQLLEASIFNPTAALIYVKFYNKTTAPTVGTDVPLFTIPVPVNGVASFEFGAMGKRFATGIGIAITAGPLATDVAAVAVGAQVSATFL
jgi:hypothetical protein